MSLRNYISENIILKISDLLTGLSIHEKLNFLLGSQYWSTKQIETFQNERLRFLIQHAYDTVPYYQDLFNEVGLFPKNIREGSDLLKIPLLTKSVIKREGNQRFTSTGIAPNKAMNQSSSGSTGEPLFYTTTKDAYSMNIAANLRGWYWMGYRLGDKYAKLSQNPRNAPLKKMQDYFSGNLYLATNPMIGENFDYILHQLERYKPKIIRCYPDPLLMLAKYKRSRQKFKFQPVAITTTGNTLFPEIRKEIEEAFGCKVFDSYSCEGNSNVFECPTHTCYHSAVEYGFTEVIDNEGKPVEKGIGRLISTDLWNLAHPFIRYDTQDLVEIDTEPCVCGRKHLKIKRIIGRDNDILQMPNGRFFIVHNFTGFFQTDHIEINRSVDQFQIIKKNDKVIFSLVVNEFFNDEIGGFIRKYWAKELDFIVEIEVVQEIKPSENGKRRFIINE